MSSNGNLGKIEQLTRDLVLTNDQLEKVSSLLLDEFNCGLSRELHESANVKMFPTYVRDVPNGKGKFKEGKFLALDLGGTNFRVLLIDLAGEYCQMENEIYAIPKEIMLGTGAQLFDHIAECLANFMDKWNVMGMRLPLGFTFSFPCKQEGLTKARLVQWTKGFKCTGVEGEDVVQLLRAAIKRRSDIEIDVMAIVNDTTGTLMSCAHKNRECRVGLIVGTGTNACYMETLENVQQWDDEMNDPKQVIVNTEWGAFGDNRCLDFLRVAWDEEVDENSLNQGKQLFEKMISGMYLGEVVRCILVDMTKKKLLFNGTSTPELLKWHGFDTKYVSWIESDAKNEYTETRKALEKIKLNEIASDEDCESLRLICSRVSTRAAYLVSAAIACILNKIRRPHTIVGVDGSVYRYHPHFHSLMEKKIAELIKPECKFSLMLSEDGSGRGAALVAAVAVRQKQREKARKKQQLRQQSAPAANSGSAPVDSKLISAK